MLFAESPSVFEPQSESVTNSGKAIGLYEKTSPTGGPGLLKKNSRKVLVPKFYSKIVSQLILVTKF